MLTLSNKNAVKYALFFVEKFSVLWVVFIPHPVVATLLFVRVCFF